MSFSRSVYASIMLTGLLCGCGAARTGLPADNPARAFDRTGWTGQIAWDRTVSVAEFEAATDRQRFEKAQASLGEAGGVVYFPAGTYRFDDHLLLADGVVIRGADPTGQTDARRDDYALGTRFVFPKFEPKLSGEGTPIDTAFKGIRLADPAAAARCGVVNVAIDHGHIDLGQDARRNAGRNRLVVGCILTNAARASREVPDARIEQHAWQRFTEGHAAAIRVFTGENALIANNRLAKSDASFAMPGYIVQGRGNRPGKQEITATFDYDNRPGISVNLYSLGGVGTRDPKATPETLPSGFRKGIVIARNYVYSTGRSCIGFSGDGTICADNVVRMQPGVKRYTHTGRHMASGSATNDNRPLLVRGWRYTIEGNDLVSARNLAGDGPYSINDGEGIMHEGHANSTVKDSRIINNKVNAYISIYMTAGIDGLEIRGNDVRPLAAGVDTRIPAIYVRSDRTWDRHFIRNVRVLDNVSTGKILLMGAPAADNLVKGNRFVGQDPDKAVIVNMADAKVVDNEGYKEVVQASELPLADPNRPSAVWKDKAD